MARRAQKAVLLVLPLLLWLCALSARAADARFDLVGPRIDVRVTRAGQTLPIAAVPNLQPGDRLWIHPDLPQSQSVKYLLICVFLRGTTNPPPENWFFRIETWDRKVREEGAFVTVPAEAQQALLFMAPETGGDFSTLRSAVQGRPGAFVRASQDLTEAGFEEARIEKYVASIRRVPPSDPALLLKHSDLLARTLDLKPNNACFQQPVDTQFTCLTQSGSQIVLDDGHGQSVVAALSSGPNSDFIAQASYTQAFGAGVYSAYVGAIVDLVRIMGNLHTAQYQYIPAISFPQAEAMNLRLNTPPSFHNPKSVLVIALPSIQAAEPPPLRAADPTYVACLIKPSVTLPIEGAPLVFSTDFAHDLVLHLNTPPGAPTEPDIPLTPDAYAGGLVLQQTPQHHVPLEDPKLLSEIATPSGPNPFASTPRPPAKPQPEPGVPGQPAGRGGEPVTVTGTIEGRWGFDAYTGPTVPLQQLPGHDWTLVPPTGATSTSFNLIAGHATQLLLTSTGSACVHTITAQPTGQSAPVKLTFKPDPQPDQPNLLAVTLPLNHDITPGDLHLAIQQYDQPAPNKLSARTFAEPARITAVEFHAGDRTLRLDGARLNEIASLTLGDLPYTPASEAPGTLSESSGATPSDNSATSLQLVLAPRVPTPSTHPREQLTATVTLHDGRTLTVPVTVSAPRPVLTMLSKTVERQAGPGASGQHPGSPAALAAGVELAGRGGGSEIALTNADDLPLSSRLTFTLKTPTPFPRNGQIEIETLDGTLRTVLTLAPSGGLILQDPHTIVATLDPLSSFGPSAFGALRVRAIYPAESSARSADVSGRSTARNANTASFASEPGPPQTTATALDAADPATAAGETPNPAASSSRPANWAASNWLPLATLVRLPDLTELQCPTDPGQPCNLTGSDLFLLQAISTDPAFTNPVAVPDGYTGQSLTIPHPSAATIFLKLRDDPDSIDSAIVPVPTPVVAHVRAHRKPAVEHESTPPPAEAPSSIASPESAPATNSTPAPAAVAPATVPNSPEATPQVSAPAAPPPQTTPTTQPAAPGV